MSSNFASHVQHTVKHPLPLSWVTTVAAVTGALFLSSYLVEFCFYAVRVAHQSGEQATESDALSLDFRVAASLILQMIALSVIACINGYRLVEYFATLQVDRKRRITSPRRVPETASFC